MPWIWQNSASLPHFSSSGKTWEVLIPQAFQLYRKSSPSCLCLGFVVSSHCRFSCPQSCCQWGTDLAQSRTGPLSMALTQARQAQTEQHIPFFCALPAALQSAWSTLACKQLVCASEKSSSYLRVNGKCWERSSEAFQLKTAKNSRGKKNMPRLTTPLHRQGNLYSPPLTQIFRFLH